MERNVTLNDGLTSFHTSLGKKSSQRIYKTRELSDSQLRAMYLSSWIAQKFINKTAEDAVKRWREIESSDFSPEEIAHFGNLEKKYKLKDAAEECLIWASLYGEAIILAVTDAGEDSYESELDLATENIQRFVVIDKGMYKGESVVDDILSPKFGYPALYVINGNLRVHHSRVYHAIAGMRPLSQSKQKRAGISDLQGCIETIKMFDTISTCVSDLSEESKVDVLKIKNMNNQVAAGNEDMILKYVDIAQASKSQSNALVIDAETEYEQKEISFAGLSDLWVKAGNVLAGAMDRPVTILFGQSASGFNSGEEDNKNYYDTINALQESRLRPMLDFFDAFIFDLMNKKPDEWEYTFPTLDAMNKLDEANIFNTWATGIGSLLQNGVINEEMSLLELKQRGLFTNITDEDIKSIKELGAYYDPNEYDRTTQATTEKPNQASWQNNT